MTALDRYIVHWLTSSGGPGVSVFHLDATVSTPRQSQVNAIRAAFDAIKGFLPTDVSISFSPEIEVIERTTNTLIGTVAVAPPASVTGTNTGAYSAPSGARWRWATGVIHRGRRVTGTTFLVPLSNSAYDVDGTLTAAALTTLNNAAAGILTAAPGALMVYSRPAGGDPGIASTVTGGSTVDRAAVLRSRRD